MMISFTHPLAWLLLPVLGLALWPRRRHATPALGVPDIRAALDVAVKPSLAWLPDICRLAGIALTIAALAGPGIGPQPVVWRGRGVDLMLVLDLSETMAALDFRQGQRTVSRLEAVTAAASRFVAARPGDRIGLIAFGSRAYTVVPRTTDHRALTQALTALRVGAAGKRTALGDALALAVKRLRNAPGQSRAIVLWSDGRSNSGDISPRKAAALAAGQRIPIHAVGIGSDRPAPFLIDHPLLGPEIVQEKADIDEAALRALTHATGGTFRHAADAAGLATAIRHLYATEPSDMTAVPVGHRTSLAPALALVAAGLLAGFAWLTGTRFTRLP